MQPSNVAPTAAVVMTRVLYPLNSQHIGGGNRSMLTLWAGLRPYGVQPVAVSPEAGAMPDACADAGVSCLVSPLFLKLTWREPVRSMRAFVEWRSIIRRTGSTIVHSNGFKPSQSLALSAASLGIPHICHVRFGAEPDHLRWVFRGLPKPDLFIFNSQALADETWPHLEPHCRQSSFEVVHNAVDLTGFHPVDEAPGPCRIGILANLNAVKGHDDFLRMAQLLKQRGVDAEYWIIGADLFGEGLEPRLRALAATLGVDRETTFWGHRRDVPELLAKLTVLVCASHEEPFGRCLIEAMACGKPVVATRVGGIPEVVVDNVTGLLVAPRSPEQLCDAVARIVLSPSLGRQLGAAGLERVRELFSAEAHAVRIQAIYDRLSRGEARST